MHLLIDYPKIGIRNKYELAKQISSKQLAYSDAVELIDNVCKNFDQYWYDSKKSKPEEQKYIRSTAGKPLGKLLKLIDRKILAPHDKLIPYYIFGGISGRSHLQASKELLGKKKGRILHKTDLKRFFEQVKKDRVFSFFYNKCGCTVKASNLLASLCCVPMGPKGTIDSPYTLARGFHTSPRLSVWCNLGTFQLMRWKAQKILKGLDPRTAIYVDDIGISASRVPDGVIKKVIHVVPRILENNDSNQKLLINNEKTLTRKFADQVEHLGTRLGRNKLSVGKKTIIKLSNYRKRLHAHDITRAEKNSLIKKIRSIYTYINSLQRL